MRKQSHEASGDAVAVRTKLSPELSQFSRFLVVGLINAVAGFLLFLLFFGLCGWHYLLANMLVFISWAWFGFELQRRWAFRTDLFRGNFSKYLINQTVFVAIGTLALFVFVQFVRLRPELAYVVTLGVTTAGMYLSSRFWVFRPPTLSESCENEGSS